MTRAAGSRERGSAAVEFVMVSVVLILLFAAVLQVGIYFHLRNVIAASAAEGARYGANADRTYADASTQTHAIVRQAINGGVADRLQYAANLESGAAGVPLVRVQVTGDVPSIFAPLGARLPVRITARAIKEIP